jgi:hypothetical protein
MFIIKPMGRGFCDEKHQLKTDLSHSMEGVFAVEPLYI